MATTKAPSGLTITRNGNTFECSWKISDSDYEDGQQFGYLFSPEASAWSYPAIDTRDTNYTLTFNPSRYYPDTNLRMNTVKFSVRGNRAAYTENNKTINLGWSGWTTKQFDVYVPNKPYDVHFTQDSDLDNVGSFSWFVDVEDDAPQIFRRVQWQSSLVKGTAQPKWSSQDLAFSTGVSSKNDGSVEFTETFSPTMGQSYTRWFRIRSQGPRGDSGWTVAKHVWAIPNVPRYTVGVASFTSKNNTTNISVTFDVDQSNGEKPVDSVDVQYAFATPGENGSFPSSAEWQTGVTVRDTANPRQAVQFNVEGGLGLDRCLYVRVNSNYDRQETFGNPHLVQWGELTPPTIVSVDINEESAEAEIQATNNSPVPESFLVVYYTDSLNEARPIGIIPHGESSILSLAFPYNPDAKDPYFSVRACQGSYYIGRTDGAVNYYTVEMLMSSSMVTQGGAIPKVPTINVEDSDIDGVARVTWSWDWDLAEGITISWSDDQYAWQSINAPDTHNVERLESPVLYVSGLDITKKYYFRARFFNEAMNSTSEWSDPVEFVPSSTPDAPILSLSSNVIFVLDSVEAQWLYNSRDGLPQGGFELAIVTVDSEGNIESTTQYLSNGATSFTSCRIWHYVIEFHTLMPPGTTVNFAVRVKSTANRWSDWSNIVSLTCAYPVSINMPNSSLVTKTVDDHVFYELVSMPLSLTVTGAGEGGTTSVYILRADDYHVDRPDGKDFDGYKGEIIAYRTQVGEGEIVFGLEDLYGSFDDGASYTINAAVSDTYGQTASMSLTFKVAWMHQPTVPEAYVRCYPGPMVSTITVSEPTDYTAGDTFDVYRLSADSPELIIQNGEYGTTYVDPYPAFNYGSGYRVVNKTASGDYITAENKFAWLDIFTPFIEYYRLVIDFSAQKAVLPYNLTFDNTWSKDFTRTEYLGGSVVGDWNPQITKDISVSTVLIPEQDEETISIAHSLAEYPGVCHVRTPHGNSFSADVQLSENITYDGLLYDYSLEIKKVDNQSLDGVTLEEWERSYGPLS